MTLVNSSGGPLLQLRLIVRIPITVRARKDTRGRHLVMSPQIVLLVMPATGITGQAMATVPVIWLGMVIFPVIVPEQKY